VRLQRLNASKALYRCGEPSPSSSSHFFDVLSTSNILQHLEKARKRCTRLHTTVRCYYTDLSTQRKAYRDWIFHDPSTDPPPSAYKAPGSPDRIVNCQTLGQIPGYPGIWGWIRSVSAFTMLALPPAQVPPPLQRTCPPSCPPLLLELLCCNSSPSLLTLL